MSKTKTYNGHKNWNHWNVSLWINNDEGLYNLARMYARKSGGRDAAAESMLEYLNESGIYKTPDGAPYSRTTIKAAMRGM